MADPKTPAKGESRWVVLLNKSPKGPLTESEVKALLENGILRPNDAGFQVSEGTGENPVSDWKLLWQFPEFDRRRNEPTEPPSPAPKPPEAAGAGSGKAEERRRQMPPEEAKKRLMEILPTDLAAINPEDLLSHPTRGPARFDRAELELGAGASSAPEAPSSAFNPSELFSKGGGPLRWILGGLTLTAVSFGIFYWLGARPAVPKPPTRGSASSGSSERGAPDAQMPTGRSRGTASSVPFRGRPGEPARPPQERESQPSSRAETPLDEPAEPRRGEIRAPTEEQQEAAAEAEDKRAAEEEENGEPGRKRGQTPQRPNAPIEKRAPDEASPDNDPGADGPVQPQPPEGGSGEEGPQKTEE